IQEYRFLQVSYESMVNWQETTDYLRCSPLFNKHQRYDFVIVDAIPKPIFAQLLMIFTCTVLGSDFAIAFIRPLNARGISQKQKDIDDNLDLHRVRSKPMADSGFIFVRSIQRGALLINDPDHWPEFDFFVVDTIDGDMFLRCQELFR
ncbi:hypothetical protein DENSPDRAFT_789887, partial [Dentipellis sp. KUC8613]